MLLSLPTTGSPLYNFHFIHFLLFVAIWSGWDSKTIKGMGGESERRSWLPFTRFFINAPPFPPQFPVTFKKLWSCDSKKECPFLIQSTPLFCFSFFRFKAGQLRLPSSSTSRKSHDCFWMSRVPPNFLPNNFVYFILGNKILFWHLSHSPLLQKPIFLLQQILLFFRILFIWWNITLEYDEHVSSGQMPSYICIGAVLFELEIDLYLLRNEGILEERGWRNGWKKASFIIHPFSAHLFRGNLEPPTIKSGLNFGSLSCVLNFFK